MDCRIGQVGGPHPGPIINSVKSCTGLVGWDVFGSYLWDIAWSIIINQVHMKNQPLSFSLSEQRLTDDHCSPPQPSQQVLPIPRKRVKARPLVAKRSGVGKWSRKEQQTYIAFLEVNAALMKEGRLRKAKKVFIRMSKKLRTRAPQQCRSHHQKMISLHRSSEEIVRFFKEEVFPLCQPVPAPTPVSPEPARLYQMQVIGSHIRLSVTVNLIGSY